MGLCIVLGAGCLSVRAADNPAQAVARLALEQKLGQPNAWEPQPLRAVTASSVTVAQPSVKSSAGLTGTVSAKAAASPVVQPPATPMVASAAIAPTATAPGRFFLIMLSLLVISFLTISFLLVKLLRQNSRYYESNRASTGSRN